MTGRVYIANFGQGNVLWPRAKATPALITIDDVRVHPNWQAGDRGAYVTTAMAQLKTALGKPRRVGPHRAGST